MNDQKVKPLKLTFDLTGHEIAKHLFEIVLTGERRVIPYHGGAGRLEIAEVSAHSDANANPRMLTFEIKVRYGGCLRPAVIKTVMVKSFESTVEINMEEAVSVSDDA